MDWNDLKFFLAVANTRSLSAASAQLGVSASTVSRRIQTLEVALRVKLFRAHRDGYDLTQAGRDLLAPAEQAEAQMRSFERAAREKDNDHTGPVRLDVPELVGEMIVLPLLAGLAQDHPGIRVEMHSSVRPVHLSAEATDIVLRLSRPDQGAYRQRRLGRVQFGIFGSSDYLTQNGAPAALPDLYRHRIIGWTNDLRYTVMAAWLETHCPGLQPALRLSSLRAQMAAVENGLGLAVLPAFAAGHIAAQPVLPDAPQLAPDLWMFTHEQAANLPRVRLVGEALRKALSTFASNSVQSLR